MGTVLMGIGSGILANAITFPIAIYIGYLRGHTIRNLLDRRLRKTKSLKDDLAKIVRAHIIDFKEVRNVGYKREIKVRWFVDLQTASTKAESYPTLVRCMYGLVSRRLNSGLPDFVAVPKLGNVILASALARRMNRPLVIVRHDEIALITDCLCDGELRNGATGILVDDVASEGVFLDDCIKNIQNCGAQIAQAFVLVERKELADSEEDVAQKRLLRVEVELQSLLSYSDADLEGLQGALP